MAFRRFHNEEYYEAPDINILTEGLNAAAQNMGQFFRSIGAQDRAQRQAADQFKFDIGQRKFESDDRIIKEREFAAINQMKQAIRSGDKTAQREAERVLHELRTDANQSDIQMKRLETMLGQVNKRADDDIYYDKSFDEELVKKAHGGYETYYGTRGEKIDAAEAAMFKNPKALKINQYTADYIKTLGQQKKTVSTGNPNVVDSRYSEYTFWDPKTGAIGVQPQDAVNYMKSRPDGSVQRFFEADVNEELDKEIQTMKKSGNPKNSWMSGMSDAAIKDRLINNPSDNTENQTEFGIRVRDKAQQQLERQADVQTKVDVEYKKDTTKTKGLYNNDSLAYSPGFKSSNIGASDSDVTGADGSTVAVRKDPSSNGGPGFNLLISKGVTVGKPIQFESSGKNVFDIASGKSIKAVGPFTFNMDGGQVQAYRKDGTPVIVNAKDETQFKNWISGLSYEDFANMEPKLSIALRGYTINKANMLGDVRSSLLDAAAKLRAAKDNNNLIDQQTWQGKITDINRFLDDLNADPDEFVDDDIVLAATTLGVTQIKNNVLVKAESGDLSMIDTFTQGLNLNKREKRSQDMNDAMDLYEKRYKEAAAAGFTSQKTKPAAKKTTAVITSDGSDTDSWKTSNEYKVGDNTYYYNKSTGKWAKR